MCLNRTHIILFLLFQCILLTTSKLSNDLIEEDEQEQDKILNYASIENPFRMQKINLVWEKARAKLTESKLRKLFTELKVQDKEHLTLKRLKADGGDKDGLKEADVRRKYNSVLYSYGLVQQIDDPVVMTDGGSSDVKRSGLFKDKKLNKLWLKAQKAGLSEEELIVLKSEFLHHQEKVEEYHQLQEMSLAARDDSKPNEIHPDADETPVYLDPNTLDGKSKEIKKNYDRLHRLALNSHPTDFEEPKVEGLWRLAQEADFSPEELDSIRTELKHYEQRIKKLNHLEAELHLVDSRHDEKPIKTEGRKKMDSKMIKHADAIEQIHQDLITRIAARHSEL